ncbi:D-alanyl-D-alanine carboxypeptidase family protein [Ureibacillus thermosphaericus]|uniref:D-alanyl-D-alanine carboxypeptidase n=1 Tax=Ureibacillus thermosphaericus TaxID=51173 RepID=A0A840PSG6_URETH|nr:D-alanyl-D-alanine carboxypeptidase family protein [Ureibacillus thermosphaericus]MBB5147721.1 D-alanyl-D-alanine carboxypeptidase [Ureibacillus thermosphaericus]
MKLAKFIITFAFSLMFYFSLHHVVKASYVVIDADTGRTLIGNNEHARMPIASLTKIWTALIAIENSNLDDEVVISREATMSEGSSIYLEPGEVVTVETLLYGLMLRSGNDAAYALAEHAGGSVEGFVDLMNEKALYYRLNQTYFTNPSGLHHDLHLSSAYDTAQMLRIALENEDFLKIASTIQYKSNTKNGTTWLNKHRLLRENVGAVAGKTGYTKVAGRTLATYFEKENERIIVVTLNEANDWQVHKQLANQVFEEYDVKTIVKKGKYKANDNITVQLKEPIKLLISEEEEDQLQNVLHLSRNQDVKFGIWHVFLNNESIYSTKVKLK